MDPFGAKARQSNIMRSGRRQKKDGKKNADKTRNSPVTTRNGDNVDGNDVRDEIDVKCFRDTRNSCITGMEFVENGDLVLIDSANYCLKVVDMATLLIKSWTEIRYKPWDLAEFEPGYVIVTCPVNKKLLFMNLSNGYNYHQLLLSGVCFGVVVHNKIFIVSFTYPNAEIQFLNNEGQKLKSVNIFSTGQLLFKSPRYLTLCPDRSSFYVSDWGNDTVFKVTLTGGIEGMYTHRQVKNPRGVVPKGRGCIFIAGWGSSNISQASASCEHNDIILNESNGIHLPQCLAVRQKIKSSVTELYVSQDGSKQNAISIYRLK